MIHISSFLSVYNRIFFMSISLPSKRTVGIEMDEREFHCRGEFEGIHKGRSDESNLKAAAEFAMQFK